MHSYVFLHPIPMCLQFCHLFPPAYYGLLFCKVEQVLVGVQDFCMCLHTGPRFIVSSEVEVVLAVYHQNVKRTSVIKQKILFSQQETVVSY